MAFKTLPIELNEQIATYLDIDNDVCNYALICHDTHAAVHSHRGGVWRAMFAKCYDLPPNKTGAELQTTYMLRAMYLQNTQFDMGHEFGEIRCMEILRDLVVESYANVPAGFKAQKKSKNLKFLRQFLKKSNFLDVVHCYVPFVGCASDFMQTLQLVFTHWQVDQSLGFRTHSFEFSQQAVYSTAQKWPLFLDKFSTKVNVEYLLHIVNFFKHHMTGFNEQMFDIVSELEEDEKPGPWDRKLFQGPGVKKLGKYWKGAYAYLPDSDNVSIIRKINPANSHHFFIDALDLEDGFQVMELDFAPAANKLSWPQVFENHLHALPTVPLCQILEDTNQPSPLPLHRTVAQRRRFGRHAARAPAYLMPQSPPSTPGHISVNMTFQPSLPSLPDTPPLSPPVTHPRKNRDYIPFIGTGQDIEPYNCSGILHPIPPQREIPGWQRISMMKYNDRLPALSPQSAPTSVSSSDGGDKLFTPTNERFRLDDEEEFEIRDGCWAYEGVVLPGGAIMMGRWWSPLGGEEGEGGSTGPFIFWNVGGRD